MGTFAFRAVDVVGVPSRGEVDAETKGQVTERLRERGLIVLDVSEKNEAMRLEKVFDRFRGYELIGRIRALPGGRTVPTVALTALAPR